MCVCLCVCVCVHAHLVSTKATDCFVTQAHQAKTMLLFIWPLIIALECHINICSVTSWLCRRTFSRKVHHKQTTKIDKRASMSDIKPFASKKRASGHFLGLHMPSTPVHVLGISKIKQSFPLICHIPKKKFHIFMHLQS